MDFMDLFDYLVPVIMIYYGFRWLTNTPEFKATNGLGTKYAKMSEENWRIAHDFGGKLAIAFGILMLALVFGKRFIGGEELQRTMGLVVICFNFALVIVFIPIVNAYIKRKME